MMLLTVPATRNVNFTGPATTMPELFFSKTLSVEAPWKMATLSMLHKLSSNQSVEQRDDDLIPSQGAFMLARMAIARLPEMRLPTPIVCPVSGGAIGMIWMLGAKQLEVVFEECQSGSFVLTDHDVIVEDGDIEGESSPQLTHALKGLLQS